MNWRLVRVLFFIVSFVAFMHWAGGKRAFKYTVGGLWHMLTRVPMLIAWSIGTMAMLYVLWTGAIEQGNDPLDSPGLLIGLSVFCGAGFAALVVPPVWMLTCLRKPEPQLELDEGEVVRWEKQANHLMGRESRGGMAYLTDRAIRFVPKRMNLQTEPWQLALEDIARAEVTAGRLLLFFDESDDEHALILHDPAELAHLIAEAPPARGAG